jgi:hypothetical protein
MTGDNEPLAIPDFLRNQENLKAERETSVVTSSLACECSRLCFASDQDLAALAQKRHHSACPLYKTEKHPRLFYYEEAEDCWTPAPDMVDCLVSLDSFSGHGDTIEIDFKRIDMTDEEYDNMPEV